MKAHTLKKAYHKSSDSRFILESPKLETTQMSINKWTDLKIVVYPYNGILYSIQNSKRISLVM